MSTFVYLDLCLSFLVLNLLENANLTIITFSDLKALNRRVSNLNEHANLSSVFFQVSDVIEKLYI